MDYLIRMESFKKEVGLGLGAFGDVWFGCNVMLVSGDNGLGLDS